LWDIRQDIRLYDLYLGKYMSSAEDWSLGSLISIGKHKLMLAGGGLTKVITLELEDGYEEQFNHNFDDLLIILSPDGQLVACIREWKIIISYLDSEADSLPKILGKPGKNQDKEDWIACFSLDNRYFASRQDHDVVKVWEVSSTRCLQVLKESEWIDALTFSPDSQLLGMGYASGEIIIWNWEARIRLKTFTGHQNAISCLAFSPNGAWLVSASEDDTVKLWDNLTQTFNEEITFDFETGRIEMAMDSQRIVTLSPDSGIVRVWDTLESKYIETFKNIFKNRYYDVAISADGGVIAATSVFKHAIEIWDVGSNHLSTVHSDYLYPGSSVAFSANGERFIVHYVGGIVEVRESRTGLLLKPQRSNQFGFDRTCPAISLDGERVAWTDDRPKERTKIYTDNVHTEVLRELHYHHNKFDPQFLGFSQNGARLAAVGSRCEGVVWDVETGVCLRTWKFPGKNEPYEFIYLNPGFVNLDFTKATCSPALVKWEDCFSTYCISSSGVWVLRNGKRVLWIPPEYRPNDVTVSGTNIAIGRVFGPPYVIGFSEDSL
jgi:WD40 repeat protein